MLSPNSFLDLVQKAQVPGKLRMASMMLRMPSMQDSTGPFEMAGMPARDIIFRSKALPKF